MEFSKGNPSVYSLNIAAILNSNEGSGGESGNGSRSESGSDRESDPLMATQVSWIERMRFISAVLCLCYAEYFS